MTILIIRPRHRNNYLHTDHDVIFKLVLDSKLVASWWLSSAMWHRVLWQVFLKYLVPPFSGYGDVGCRLLPNVGRSIPMNLIFPAGRRHFTSHCAQTGFLCPPNLSDRWVSGVNWPGHEADLIVVWCQDWQCLERILPSPIRLHCVARGKLTFIVLALTWLPSWECIHG